MSEKRKKRPLWLRLGFTLAVILIFLVLAELGLRISKQFINRDPTVSSSIDDCKSIVILTIGDSMTFGLGAQPIESYPMQLPPFFKRQYGGIKAKVYNIGMPGSNTSEGLKRIRSFLTTNKKVKPDIALVLYGVNNRWNLHQASFWRWNKEAKKENFTEYLTSRFQLNKLFKVTIQDRNGRPKKGKYQPKHEYHEMLKEHGWEMFFQSFRDDLLYQWLTKDLSDMAAELRRRNIEPVFLTYHYPRFPELNPVIKEVAKKQKVTILDIEKPMEYYKSGNMFDPDRFHLNARGYKNMAKRVVLKLKEKYNEQAMRDMIKKKKQSRLCKAGF